MEPIDKFCDILPVEPIGEFCGRMQNFRYVLLRRLNFTHSLCRNVLVFITFVDLVVFHAVVATFSVKDHTGHCLYYGVLLGGRCNTDNVRFVRFFPTHWLLQFASKQGTKRIEH